jgi:hypothetical protein
VQAFKRKEVFNHYECFIGRATDPDYRGRPFGRGRLLACLPALSERVRVHSDRGQRRPEIVSSHRHELTSAILGVAHDARESLGDRPV